MYIYISSQAENAVQMLWVIRANTDGEPCGDTERYSVCLGCFKRADVYIYIVVKCYCVIRPANTGKSDISQI